MEDKGRKGDDPSARLWTARRNPPGSDGRPRPARLGGYRVRIVYTEPSFQIRNPQCPPEFSGTFDFPQARSEAEAIARALEEWAFCAGHSRVGWRRFIKSMSIES